MKVNRGWVGNKNLASNLDTKYICYPATSNTLFSQILCWCCLVSVQVVHLYSSIDTTAARKKLRFILSVRSDFHMFNSLSIAVHAFVSRMLMSFLVDETLLASNIEQVLAATPHKAPTIRPPASHHENYPS